MGWTASHQVDILKQYTKSAYQLLFIKSEGAVEKGPATFSPGPCVCQYYLFMEGKQIKSVDDTSFNGLYPRIQKKFKTVLIVSRNGVRVTE